MPIDYTHPDRRIDYTHPKRRTGTNTSTTPGVPIVDLDAALAAGCRTSRVWSTPSGPVSQSIGSALVLVEQPRFVGHDPDNGMTAVIAERGFSGRSILVGTDGRSLTSSNFVDHDVAYAANGSMALTRRHTAQALGIPAGGDYIQGGNSPRPWSDAAVRRYLGRHRRSRPAPRPGGGLPGGFRGEPRRLRCQDAHRSY